MAATQIAAGGQMKPTLLEAGQVQIGTAAPVFGIGGGGELIFQEFAGQGFGRGVGAANQEALGLGAGHQPVRAGGIDVNGLALESQRLPGVDQSRMCLFHGSSLYG